MRTTLVAVLLLLGLCASAGANWFNQSEQYLAGSQSEAEHRYYRSTSSKDVRHHIYLCMLAHGYAFKSGCDENGWLDPGCYRLKNTRLRVVKSREPFFVRYFSSGTCQSRDEWSWNEWSWRLLAKADYRCPAALVIFDD